MSTYRHSASFRAAQRCRGASPTTVLLSSGERIELATPHMRKEDAVKAASAIRTQRLQSSTK